MNAGAFVARLEALEPLVDVFNPWRDWAAGLDAGPEAPEVRRNNLSRYLVSRTGRARLVLVGEAPGYLGCRWTGLAMTSERILLGHKPEVPPSAVFSGPKHRTSLPERYPRGANEMTASIAWSLLLGLGLEPDDFILWNAFPCHPHRPDAPMSNRAPRPHELRAYADVLPAMLSLAPDAQLVAVGRVALASLEGLGLQARAVRHPAMGGASAFRAGIRELLC